jgi:hypothetical protein
MINYKNDFDTEVLNQIDSNYNTPIFDESINGYKIPLLTINSSDEEKFFIKGQIQFLNKKRKNDSYKKPTNHRSKYSYDNLKRECKHLVIENAMSFVNKKIFEEYNGNIGEGILEKKLYKLNQNQKKNSNAEFNQLFIKKTLKEILSQNITKKIKYFNEDHNKRVIEKVLEEKKGKFEKLFNITFIECLDHFIGNKKIEVLNGFTLFNELKENIVKKNKDEGISYYENLEIFLKEFEKRINDSKPRKKSLTKK